MKTRIILTILSTFLFINIFAQQGKKEQNISIMPDSCEFITIYSAKDFNLKGCELFLNWYGDPYVIKDNIIAGVLPDSTFNIFELPNQSSPNRIICTENGITYLKNGNMFQILEGNNIRTLFTMKNDKFLVNLANELTLYITTFTKDSSMVFVFDTQSSQIMKLFAMAGKINDIAGDGLNTYIAKGHEIFLLANNNIFKIMRIEQDITKLAWTEYGLFFSTTTNIGYIVNPHQPFLFITKAAKNLLPYENQMYIQFEDGTISILLGLEYFENFVNSIYNN